MDSSIDILAMSTATVTSDDAAAMDNIIRTSEHLGERGVVLEPTSSLTTLIPENLRNQLCYDANECQVMSEEVRLQMDSDVRNHSGQVYVVFNTSQEDLLERKSFQGDLRSHAKWQDSNVDETEMKQERLFPCDKCHESFPDGLALAVHERCHVNSDDVTTMLACLDCGASFAFHAALRRHQRHHRLSTQPSNLKLHHRSNINPSSTDKISPSPRSDRFIAETVDVACGVCSVILRGDEVRQHLTPPASRSYYQCEKCHGVFGQKCLVSRHVCHVRTTGGRPRRSKRRRFVLKRHEEAADISSDEDDHCEVEDGENDEDYQPPASYKLDNNLPPTSSGPVASAIYKPESSATGTEGDSQPTTPCINTEYLLDAPGGDAGDHQVPLRSDTAEAGQGSDMTSGDLSCVECQMTFVSRRNLMRHNEAQHRDRRRFQCESCASNFARLDTLVSHSVDVHNQRRRFKCSLCARSFTQRRIVSYHLQRHSGKRARKRGVKKGGVGSETGELEGNGEGDGEKIGTQDSEYTEGRLETPAVIQSVRANTSPETRLIRYSCGECCEGFNTRRRYLRHRQIKHGESPPVYTCEQCPMSYSRIDELTRHTIAVHNLRKVHKCARCTRVFTQKSIALYHEKGHDTKRIYVRQPREFTCNKCKKAFTTADERNKHDCRATKLKCVCDICGRVISCAQALKRHRLLHSDERPAKCTYPGCTMAFIDDIALSKHASTHSNEKSFLCDLCGRGFAKRDYLQRHARFHSGERPYRCSACGKSFALLDTLNRHFLIHTGEKPFTCQVCGRPFRQAQQLKTHMKVHQKETRVDMLVLDVDAVEFQIGDVVDVATTG